MEGLARQPWSNGKVGMFGASYGGFTGLPVAMKQPSISKPWCRFTPATTATPMTATSAGATCECTTTWAASGTSMLAMNALPPFPELAGPDWAEMWQQRLQSLEPYVIQYFRNQVDGLYWRSAALRPFYDRVRCPVYLIAEWHDGYTSPMLRILTQLKSSRKLGLYKFALEREDGQVEVIAEGTVRATESDFHILINLNVMRNGSPFFHKEWIETEPRRLL